MTKIDFHYLFLYYLSCFAFLEPVFFTIVWKFFFLHLWSYNQLSCGILRKIFAMRAGDYERIINYDWPKNIILNVLHNQDPRRKSLKFLSCSIYWPGHYYAMFYFLYLWLWTYFCLCRTPYFLFPVVIKSTKCEYFIFKTFINLLTHFMPLVSFCTPQKASSFLMFLRGIEWDQWHEMG